MPKSIDASYDLFSNFLTRSFLDLLEKFHLFLRHPNDHAHYLSLLQAIQAFLFIYQSTPVNQELLQNTIFNHLTLSPTVTQPTLSRLTSFRKAKHRYIKQHKQPTSDPVITPNRQLLTTYYSIIYGHQKSSIHPLFEATTPDTFILCLWEFYLPTLIQSHNTDLIHHYLETFISKKFTIASKLLTLTLKQFPDLSPTPRFEALNTAILALSPSTY